MTTIEGNLDQLNFFAQAIEPLNAQEMAQIDGGAGKTPWEAIIENAGELCATAAGFIDGLLGR